MSQAVWKLTTLAGVVGIGLLVVMNAQRGLQQQAGKTPPLAVKNAADNKAAKGLDELPENEEPPLGGPEEFAQPVDAGEKNGLKGQPNRLPGQPTPVSDNPFEDNNESLAVGPPKTGQPTAVKPLVRRPDVDDEPLLHEEPAHEHPHVRKDRRDAARDTLHVAATDFPMKDETDPALAPVVDEPAAARPDPNELPLGHKAAPTPELADDEPLETLPTRAVPRAAEAYSTEPTPEAEDVRPYVPTRRDNGPAARIGAGNRIGDDEGFGPGTKPAAATESVPARAEVTEPEPEPAPIVGEPREEERIPVRNTPVPAARHDEEESFGGNRGTPTPPATRSTQEDESGLREPPRPMPLPSNRSNIPDQIPGAPLVPDTENDIDAIAPTNTPNPLRPDPDRLGSDRGPSPLRPGPGAVPPDLGSDGPVPNAIVPEAVRATPEHPEEVIRTRDSAPSLSDLDTSGDVSGDKPSVQISKVTPPTAIIGTPLVYEILVRNTGTCRAARVVVEDRLTRNVELDGTRPQAEAIENRLIWKLGVLEPGEERKIAVRVTPLNEGRLGSVATVSFVSGPADTVVATPRLKLEVTAPPRGTLGAPVPFRYRITNVGRTPATNVVIRNPLPEGLSHPDGQDLEYAVGDLAPGETKEAELALTASKEGETINRAIATADGGDTVSAESRLKVYAATFTLTRVGPKRLYLRKPGTFNNRVVNTGSRPLEEVSIVEVIPAGLQFVSASNNGQFDERANTVTWRFPRIDPSQAEAVSIVLASVGRGQHSSVVRCIDGSGAMAEIDNMSTAQGFSSLRVTMSEIESPLIVGDRIVAKVRVVNRGSEPATGVRVAIGIPAPLNVLGVKGLEGGKSERGQLVFPPMTLEPKQELLLDIELEARTVGEARLQAFVQSDRMSDPLRTDEHTTVVSTTD